MQKPFAARMLRSPARLVCWLAVACVICSSLRAMAADTLPGLEKIHRVVFVGDSITYYGIFIDDIQACLLTRYPHAQVEFINVGQSSETVSGLSEPGFARGRFLRPDLHLRLASILEKTKPDLVVACYGMNDGIFQPFEAAHQQKFQDGMRWLHETVVKSGAKILHLTPPPFDYPTLKRTVLSGDTNGVPPFAPAYDDVLDQFSTWLVQQRKQGWDVLDIHRPMKEQMLRQRQADPAYTLTRDGIHPTDVGNWLMAREILTHWGASTDIEQMDNVQLMLTNRPHGSDLIGLVSEREHVLRDAWLTEIDHLFPGHRKGLPLPEAEKRAAELDKRIHELNGQQMTQR